MSSTVRRRGLIVIAVAIVAVVVTVATSVLDDSSTYEIVFPHGATDDPDLVDLSRIPHRRAGQVVWLEIATGDTIVVINRDDDVHQIAGIAARPGETVLHTFREQGTFSDACSVDLTVFVEVSRN